MRRSARLPARQHGVVSLAQLRELGLDAAGESRGACGRKRLYRAAPRRLRGRATRRSRRTPASSPPFTPAARRAAEPPRRRRAAGLLGWHRAHRGDRAARAQAEARHRPPPLPLAPPRRPRRRRRHPHHQRRPDARGPRRGPRRTAADQRRCARRSCSASFDLRALEAALGRVPGRKGRHRLAPRPRGLPARAALPAQRGRAKAQATVRRPTPFPSRSSTSRCTATRSDVYWPEARARRSSSTAPRRTTRATPSTPTAAATACSPRRGSRSRGSPGPISTRS